MPQQTTPAATVRRLLGGKFRVLRALSTRGMASVWLAEENQRLVVLKHLFEGDRDDCELQTRLSHEADVLAQLEDPRIPRLLHQFWDPKVGHCLVIEYQEGASLSAWRRAVGRIPYKEGAVIGQEVALALKHAHARGIVHRDLKFANVVVGVDAPRLPTVRLIDFGIAKDRKRAEHFLTQPGTRMGTVGCMAPEQALGICTSDARIDVWALGLLVYRLLTGSEPFEIRKFGDGRSIHRLPRPFPHFADHPQGLGGVVDVTMRSLSIDPSLRPDDVEEMIEALQILARGADPLWFSATYANLVNQESGIGEVTEEPSTVPNPPRVVAGFP